MKRFIMALVCLMTIVLGVNAQDAYTANDSTFADTQSITDGNTFAPTEYDAETIRVAGQNLRYSANCDALSLAFGTLGGILAVSATYPKLKLVNERDKKTAYRIASICGIASIVFYIAKIEYKWQCGRTLELYGNGARLTF